MGIFKRDKLRSVNVSSFDGIEVLPRGLAIKLIADDDNNEILIKSRVIKKPEVHLKYNKITGINVITEKEILEKNKSVVGRAVLGGVLLGPLGAILGGMSGIGSKGKADKHYFIVINYKSKDDDIKVISFEIVGASIGWNKFIDHIRGKIDYKPILEEEIYL